jgi:hypothetical protein
MCYHVSTGLYRVSPEGKVAGAWRLPPTPSSAEVKERVGLYVYSPLWAFVVCSRVNFAFLLKILNFIYWKAREEGGEPHVLRKSMSSENQCNFLV